jgi:hypothetical protein
MVEKTFCGASPLKRNDTLDAENCPLQSTDLMISAFRKFVFLRIVFLQTSADVWYQKVAHRTSKEGEQ